MKKSFKRVIASFLAVLMVMFAMPFSALAYSADEAPNWGLVFNAFTANASNQYYAADAGTADMSSLNLRGVKDTPLVWDQTNKTLTLTSAMCSTGGYSARYVTGGSSYQLQAGDYFTLTLTLDNVKEMKAAGLKLTWTGVQPAGIYQYSYEDDNGNTQTILSLIDDKHNVASLQDVVQGWIDDGETYDDAWSYVSETEYATKGIPVADLSPSAGGYTNLANVDWINACTFGDGEGDESYFNYGICADNVDWVDVSSIATQGSRANRAKNPETGANAYAWSYRAPLGTYLFKVTDPTNIDFMVATPAVYGGTFVAKTSDAKADVFDYGFNYDPVTGAEYPTSCGMNFLGENVNKQTPVVTYPTVSFYMDGETEPFATYTADEQTTTYTVPNLANYTKAPDSTNHYAAQWKDNNVPSGNFGATDESFVIEFAATPHTYGAAVTDPAPTCTTQGTDTYTCTGCDYYYTEPVDVDPNAHVWGEWAIDETTWNTTTDPLVEANNSATVNVKRVCTLNANHVETDSATVSVSSFTASTEQAGGSVTFTAYYGDAIVGQKTVELDPIQHVHDFTYAIGQEIPNTRVPSTCATLGSYQTANYCACGAYDDTSVATVNLTEYDYTNHVNLVDVAAKAATCTTAGNPAYSYCDACGKYYISGSEVPAAATVIPALQHDFTGAIDITWTPANGTGKDQWGATGVQHCTRCTETTPVEVTLDYTKQDADKKTAGFEKWDAKVNGNIEDTKTQTIAALGVDITVTATDLGTITGDIESNGAEVTKNFAFGKKFTVTAVPAGSTFLGWQINGKLVSQDTTYSGIAYTDTILTPVFQETTDDTINVFFYDKYGNNIKSFEGVTAAAYQEAVADAVPAAPNYPGYKFTGYDKSDDEIKANAESATFWAQYEKDTEAATYTVTAPGATITGYAGTIQGDSMSGIPYDTKITVTCQGATAWKIGESVVAYGESYTFYVGSDVTVEPTELVGGQPTVAIISTSNSGNSYTVLATRSGGPSNVEIVERGWIFGTPDGIANATIDTAEAAGFRVRRGATTASEQFSLTFNIKNAGTTVNVKAFIIDKNGNEYYSDAVAVSK